MRKAQTGISLIAKWLLRRCGLGCAAFSTQRCKTGACNSFCRQVPQPSFKQKTLRWKLQGYGLRQLRPRLSFGDWAPGLCALGRQRASGSRPLAKEALGLGLPDCVGGGLSVCLGLLVQRPPLLRESQQNSASDVPSSTGAASVCLQSEVRSLEPQTLHESLNPAPKQASAQSNRSLTSFNRTSVCRLSACHRPGHLALAFSRSLDGRVAPSLASGRPIRPTQETPEDSPAGQALPAILLRS